MAVVVVTDSSSRLQPDECKRWGIRQVPLHVLLDGMDLRDGVDDMPHDIHDRHATTAGATPAELGLSAGEPRLVGRNRLVEREPVYVAPAA